MLPQSLLDHERIRAQLTYALNLINMAGVDGTGLPPFNPPGSATAAATAWQAGGYGPSGGVMGPAAGMPMGYAPSASTAPSAGAPSRHMSLKELVQYFAEEHGLSFMPKHGRVHEGLPMYSFGSVTCVLDLNQGILRAFLHGSWTPVSLEQLLLAAQGHTR